MTFIILNLGRFSHEREYLILPFSTFEVLEVVEFKDGKIDYDLLSSKQLKNRIKSNISKSSSVKQTSYISIGLTKDFKELTIIRIRLD